MNKSEMEYRILEDIVYKTVRTFKVGFCPKCKHDTLQHKRFDPNLLYVRGSNNWHCLTCGSELTEETKTVVVEKVNDKSTSHK